jgi:hypothetical protein
VIIGPVDGLLACVVPVWVRVPLTTLVGAVVAVGVGVGLSVYVSSDLGKSIVLPALYQLIPIATLGALCMGVCSLLSHDYSRSHQQ